jgi:hypothetical protein
VKPAGHTQLPYSISKTPPFAQLTFEDANGKIHCYETINNSLGHNKNHVGLGPLKTILSSH